MKKEKNCRLGCVGGQAVIEGVMMKSKNHIGIAVRKPDGSIAVEDDVYTPAKEKHKIFGFPFIRGFVSFIEMMKLSFSTIDRATRMLGIDEGEETKFEKWLKKKFGKSIMDVLMPISVILGIALAIALFIYLPILITSGINALIKALGGAEMGDILKTVVEGVAKIGIFISYLALVSLIKDIRVTFMYHGAEHKSVFCYEKGLELTVDNVRGQKRFHPRCGTSFLFVMIAISIIVMILLNILFGQLLEFSLWSNRLIRLLIKLAALPIIVGLGYEFLFLAGHHPDNVIIKILSAPGLFIQRLTTREPTDPQMEVAIEAIKAALPDEYPKPAAPEGDAADETAPGTEEPASSEGETSGEENAENGEAGK